MTEGALTAVRILDAAEDVLRRFGPSKATVVDVARALGVSHGSVYRHFSSKAALRDAVAKRWLERAALPLAVIAGKNGPPIARLRRWFDELIAYKRRKALDDPELFATYMALASESGKVVGDHMQALVMQLARIIQDGVAGGDFTVTDSPASARAIFNATARFHDPSHALEWKLPGVDAAFEEVWTLALRGLTAATHRPPLHTRSKRKKSPVPARSGRRGNGPF